MTDMPTHSRADERAALRKPLRRTSLFRPDSNSKYRALIAVGVVVLMLRIAAFLSQLAVTLAGITHPWMSHFPLYQVSAIFMLFPTYIIFRILGKSKLSRQIRTLRNLRLRNIACGASLWLLSVIAIFSAFALFDPSNMQFMKICLSTIEWRVENAGPPEITYFLSTIFALLVLAAIEEFLFRGLIADEFNKFLTAPILSVTAVAVVFSLAHFPSSVIAALSRFFMSIFFSILKSKYGIEMAIGAHAMNNIWVVALILLLPAVKPHIIFVMKSSQYGYADIALDFAIFILVLFFSSLFLNRAKKISPLT